MDSFSAIFDFVRTSIVVELFALPFLLGLVLFVVGLLILGLFALSRTLGYKTTGKVIGAIERTRIKTKERNGQTIEKVKTTLIPVYEYTATDGQQRQMLSSAGGTVTLKYTTGQSVSLRVREDDGYDDVYDTDDRGALYFGLILAGIGVALMSIVGDIVAALGVSSFLVLLFAIALSVRALLAKKSSSEGKDKPPPPKTTEAERKSFEPADLHPIEFFKDRNKTAED